MLTISSTWSGLWEQFFPIFTQPGSQIFASLMTGWILSTTRKTITRILPFADPLAHHAHDAYHRFLPDARWTVSGLWKTLTLMLVSRLCRRGVITLAIDDTLFHHSGRKIDGAGFWRDAVRSTRNKIVYAWGLNLVVLTLQVQTPWGGEPLGLPINMRLHRKKEETLIELAQEMIQEVQTWLPERTLRVVGDGFYASLAGKPLSEVTIISRIRRDANLYDLPPKRRHRRRGRPRTKGKKLAKLERMAAHIRNWELIEVRQRSKRIKRLVYSRIVLWPKVTKKSIKVVISRDPEGKEKDDFFFTTDLEMSVAEVLECYGDRWAIEDTFKYAKQSLGVQEPQTYKRQGPERAAALGLWLYSMIWFWYLTQSTNQRIFMVLPWYTQKSTPSFADALTCLRRQLWQERIKTMFGISTVHNQKYEFLIEALATAA